jgi:hypothetical protein
MDGMKIELAPTQWRYSGEDEHDLSKVWQQRRDLVRHLAEPNLSNLPTARGTVTNRPDC